MKLWLDDVRPAPAGWVHARTVEEAKAHLQTGRVEEASLDHDLGRGQETGDHLVRWMNETGRRPARVSVHSSNPLGGLRMRARLAAPAPRAPRILLPGGKRPTPGR
jgi:hypothetical protein